MRGTVDIQPEGIIDLIDHLILHINNVAQNVHLSPVDAHFSAEGFAAGEEYEIYVTAYPKNDAMGQKTFASNKKVSHRMPTVPKDLVIFVYAGLSHRSQWSGWCAIDQLRHRKRPEYLCLAVGTCR